VTSWSVVRKPRRAELIDRSLETGVAERHAPAASPAEQVVVVLLAGGVARFVAGDPVAQVEAIDEVVVVQELEDPVDARPRHSALAGLTEAQGVLHL
jgi:hypothetical protein